MRRSREDKEVGCGRPKGGLAHDEQRKEHKSAELSGIDGRGRHNYGGSRAVRLCAARLVFGREPCEHEGKRRRPHRGRLRAGVLG